MRGHLIDGFLLRREQIDEQRSQSTFAQCFRDVAIARAESAAAASVREQHDAARAVGHDQIAFEGDAVCIESHRYTADGYVSGSSRLCMISQRSSGSTARVTSKCSTVSNCLVSDAKK